MPVQTGRKQEGRGDDDRVALSWKLRCSLSRCRWASEGKIPKKEGECCRKKGKPEKGTAEIGTSPSFGELTSKSNFVRSCWLFVPLQTSYAALLLLGSNTRILCV